MGLKGFFKKNENLAATGLLLLVIMIFTAVRYDYYFDLNDDVLMKDILAGVYTGTPEGHNIQMLWPMSAWISLLYKLAGSLPWYGFFLCACHYSSFGLIINRSLKFCRSFTGKLLLLFTEGLFIIGLFLDHLVSAQYTLTCTLLAASASFLFLTTDMTLPVKAFLKKNTGTVFLVFLAYLIRSEMLLLTLPIICAAGLIKWGSEANPFCKECFAKYLTVFGGILAGLLVGQTAHQIAYGSREWKTFTEYFNNRTELYDFQSIPDYAQNQAFYESIGLKESEQELLKNYNFGLDEAINEKVLGDIAAYAAAGQEAEKPFFSRLYNCLGNYYRRTVYGPSHNESDYPYNFIMLLSYLAVFVTALLIKGKSFPIRFFSIFWKLSFLGAVRTVLWIWLIMRNRVPERISHSMYLMELCILLALLVQQCSALRGKEEGNGEEEGKGKGEGKGEGEGQRQRQWVPSFAVLTLYFLTAALMVPFSIRKTDLDVQRKAENNLPYQQLYSYLSSPKNQENFYFIDVYSSVSYTEKMFADVDNSLDNYDIMGGWACKSPLWRKKLAAFHISNMEEALISQENVYYVQEASKDTGWLYGYYADKGVSISIQAVEMIDDYFEICQIRGELFSIGQ